MSDDAAVYARHQQKLAARMNGTTKIVVSDPPEQPSIAAARGATDVEVRYRDKLAARAKSAATLASTKTVPEPEADTSAAGTDDGSAKRKAPKGADTASR